MDANITAETPSGLVIRMTIAPDDDSKMVAQFVERIEKFSAFLAGRGWTQPEPATAVIAATPSAAELAAGPSFCGYPCSPTVDTAGLPSWIIADGRQATRHEKQGDTWYSYRDGENYIQVLRIPKGEIAPAVIGI